jgi:glutamate racemase
MIGVFDSGLGGLSVLAALVQALPQADFRYYADTAHVPYGNKSECWPPRARAKSARLHKLIRDHADGIDVHVEPCPGWATHVEMLQLDDPALASDIARRVEPLLAKGVDRIVLGCTHYSFLAPLLNQVIGGRARLVDVADAVARQARRLAADLAHGSGRLLLQASAHPERLRAALPRLHLGHIAARLT